MHGGAVCTIIDCATTIGLLSNDKDLRKSVSLGITANFYKGASKGQMLYVLSATDKIGKTTGFTSCEIFSHDLELLYKGSHTKAFLQSQWDKDLIENLPEN